MTAVQQQSRRFDFRAFMLKHQYKVMSVSLVVGFMWVGIHHVLATSWFFSRLSLLLAIISFFPAGLVVLIHGRATTRADQKRIAAMSTNRVELIKLEPGVKRRELGGKARGCCGQAGELSWTYVRGSFVNSARFLETGSQAASP